MKKVFAILSLSLTIAFVTGCSSGNTAQVRMSSQRLSSGLDQIITLTSKLDNIDTNQMDMNSVLSSTKSFHFDTRPHFAKYDIKNENIAPFFNEKHKNRTPIEYKSFWEEQNLFAKPSPQKFTNLARCGFDKMRTCSTLVSQTDYSSLQNLSNDCKNLSVEFVNAKANVMKSCNDTKTNLKKLRDSKKSISQDDLRTLTSYYEVVKDCINNVKSCKSCTNNIKDIDKRKVNLASNYGTINSDFLQIYNKLDSNCCALNNINYCVNEINCFVQSLNGEECPQSQNVNPYLRNNRYLSNVHKGNKNYYSSQTKKEPKTNNTFVEKEPMLDKQNFLENNKFFHQRADKINQNSYNQIERISQNRNNWDKQKDFSHNFQSNNQYLTCFYTKPLEKNVRADNSNR